MIGSCFECNGKLSSEAEACPHCGFKQQGKQDKKSDLPSWNGVLKIIVLMLTLAGVGVVMFYTISHI